MVFATKKGTCLNLSFINHFSIRGIYLFIKPCFYYDLNGDQKYIGFTDEDRVKDDSTSSAFSDGNGSTENSSTVPFHVKLFYNNEAAINLNLSGFYGTRQFYY